jgi:hypothetical protein
MRLMFVTPSVLLLLLSAAFSCAVQAASMGPDSARVSNTGLLSQFGPRLIERPSALLFVSDHGLGVPFSMRTIHFSSGWPVAAGHVVADGQRGNAAAVDGLLAAFASGHVNAGLPGGSMALTGRSLSSVSPPSAVPLPAAVWLFASALLGFVAVANRRKV